MKETKEKIVQLLKTGDKKNIDLGNELLKSQLCFSELEICAFLYSNKLVRREKQVVFFTYMFMLMNFRCTGHQTDAIEDWNSFFYAYLDMKLQNTFVSMELNIKTALIGDNPAHLLEQELTINEILKYVLS